MSKRKYSSRAYYLLIPIVAVLLILLYGFERSAFWGVLQLKYIFHAIAMTTGIWIGCMLIVQVLWVKYPWEQTPRKHLILEIILLLLYTNLFSLGLYTLEIKLGIFPVQEDLYMNIVLTNLITFIITGIHEAAEFYKQWKVNFSKSARLEKDNIEAKYQMLKNQVNPHFLFNSLNSLTSLVDDNEEAVNYINNLSDFLRYILKSRDKQLVMLREEIPILNQYMELQKSRFKESLVYKIDVDEKYYDLSTPPLVVQMLVENCIKHNIISKENPLEITVTARKNWLSVENSLQKKNESDSTGQGLKNISERYRFFTTEHVKIFETSSIFKVSIPLLLVEL